VGVPRYRLYGFHLALGRVVNLPSFSSERQEAVDNFDIIGDHVLDTLYTRNASEIEGAEGKRKPEKGQKKRGSSERG
jgi:hypothetical protein